MIFTVDTASATSVEQAFNYILADNRYNFTSLSADVNNIAYSAKSIESVLGTDLTGYSVDNITKLIGIFDTYNNILNDLLTNYDKNSINNIKLIAENIKQTFNRVSNYVEIKVTDNNIINNIYYTIYDKNMNELSVDNKLSANKMINNVVNFNLDQNIFPTNSDLFYIKIYYKSDNFYIIDTPLTYKSIGGVFEEYTFSKPNGLNKDVKNYKIYKVKNDKAESSADIVYSGIDGDILTVKSFKLFNDETAAVISAYKYLIKEELFDNIWIELNLVDYDLKDISNVLLNGSERDLSTGIYTYKDSEGTIFKQMQSYRVGNIEIRDIVE